MIPKLKRPSVLTSALAATTLLALTAAPQSARAVDLHWSGFATLGYAVSDSDYTYQGSINKQGSFKRDSVLAGQLDLQMTPQWSATLQMKVVNDLNSPDGWSLKPAWAFVAWRPGNDWLVRAGKVRVPLYLNSESLDVGVATDMARLPHEMYSISPTNDFDGLFVTRNFSLGKQEISLDAFAGQAAATARLWYRDGIPLMVSPGANFRKVDVRIIGGALTARGPDLTWRVAAMSARTSRTDGQALPVRYPRVQIAPGIAYWKVDASQPGPAIETLGNFRNLAITAGADWQINSDWRLTGEVVNMRQFGSELGSDSKAGYLALFRNIGAYTPYVSVARQRSSDTILNWRLNLSTPSMPAFVPGGAQLNAAQRVAGESGYAFDQKSLALGLAYALSPTAKIKGEWMRTQVGAISGHFDAPAGQPDATGLRVNTLSVNLSVAF